MSIPLQIASAILVLIGGHYLFSITVNLFLTLVVMICVGIVIT